MIRRPRKSTLFPYTSSSDLHIYKDGEAGRAGRDRCEAEATLPRSEEHTSELQSLRHLVCRLLLEKQKEIEGPHIQNGHMRPRQSGRVAGRAPPETDAHRRRPPTGWAQLRQLSSPRSLF